MTNKDPRVAYMTMEVAVDQALKTFAGGLGFLAGSHMRSAYELGQNMVGVSILWSYGHYDQGRGTEGEVVVRHLRKRYGFLTDPGIMVPVTVRGQRVLVKAYRLEPEVFGTVPIYLLTTDISQNPITVRTITQKLYDADEPIRLAQEIVLGRAGYRVLEAAGEKVDLYHLNEGHALPVAFEMLNRLGDLDEVRKRMVFTTHTPVKAGNEVHDVDLMREVGFFGPGISRDQAVQLGGYAFSLTTAALKMSRRANAVSKCHCHVAQEMWGHVEDRCDIISITNAQNRNYWQDPRIRAAVEKEDLEALWERKKELKQRLFDRVADECGKLLDPDVCTLVWARRFADYKRAWLPLKDEERMRALLEGKRCQILWAGKPHPNDTGACQLINWLEETVRHLPGAALLTGYEMHLSKLLKCGADLWLNTPRRPKEASGTSGMSAAMNGAIHFSTLDGWHLEYAEDGVNCFNIGDDGPLSEDMDTMDHASMFDRLETEILPLYRDKQAWSRLMLNAIRSVLPTFDSERMAKQYYEELYV